MAHIDTLRYAKALEARGFGREQAETLAEEQGKIMTNVPSKTDLEVAIERAIHTLTVRLFTFGLALTALAVAALKLIPG